MVDLDSRIRRADELYGLIEDGDRIAVGIDALNGKVKPGPKTKAWFFAMHKMQQKGFNPADVEYWKKMGWTGKKRPW